MHYSNAMDDGVWNPDMGCFVCYAELYMRAKRVTFFLAFRNVSDKRGAIATAERLMPEVQSIVLIAPEKQPYEWKLKGEKWVKSTSPNLP
jgi:hypothetical protein